MYTSWLKTISLYREGIDVETYPELNNEEFDLEKFPTLGSFINVIRFVADSEIHTLEIVRNYNSVLLWSRNPLARRGLRDCNSKDPSLAHFLWDLYEESPPPKAVAERTCVLVARYG